MIKQFKLRKRIPHILREIIVISIFKYDSQWITFKEAYPLCHTSGSYEKLGANVELENGTANWRWHEAQEKKETGKRRVKLRWETAGAARQCIWSSGSQVSIFTPSFHGFHRNPWSESIKCSTKNIKAFCTLFWNLILVSINTWLHVSSNKPQITPKINTGRC